MVQMRVGYQIAFYFFEIKKRLKIFEKQKPLMRLLKINPGLVKLPGSRFEKPRKASFFFSFRFREDKKQNQKTSYKERVNDSIQRTPRIQR